MKCDGRLLFCTFFITNRMQEQMTIFIHKKVEDLTNIQKFYSD